MTDKEILDEVYKMCCNPFERCDVKSFIEQEWQKQDEETDKYSTIGLENMSDTTYSKHWYSKPKTYKMPDGYSVDQGGVLDERHRGLDIGEDGTVTNLK